MGRPAGLFPPLCPFLGFRPEACWERHMQIERAPSVPPFLRWAGYRPGPVRRRGKVELIKFVQVEWRRPQVEWRRRRWGPGPGASMAGSEELGLREDTLRVLAAFLRRGEAAGSPVPTPPRPSYSRLLCFGGPAAGTTGPRAAEISAQPRITGSPIHREGSHTAEAGGPAGGGGRSH
nr:bcl-2-like protein 12 isoform X6 [Pan paniscus]XP_057156554.1 bcl-2-like protein 12 isoform X6 [Pan paniscus]